MTRKRMLNAMSPKCLSNSLENSDITKSMYPWSSTLCNEKQNYKRHENGFKTEEIYNEQKLICRVTTMLFVEKKQFIDASFMFYVNPVTDDKVNSEMRDSAVKDLYALNKVFFELPVEIFVKAISLLDRFITRVKVKPKYMSCVATASYLIASKTANSKINQPSVETLLSLTKCGGSALDLDKMVDIIMSKFSHNINYLTSYDFLDLFCNVPGYSRWIDRNRLESVLEMAQTSFAVCYHRPSTVALACLLVSSRDVDGRFVNAMALATKINLNEVTQAAETIFKVYRQREGPQLSSCRSMVWVINKRTVAQMKVLPRSSLSTILEESNCGLSVEDHYRGSLAKTTSQ